MSETKMPQHEPTVCIKVPYTAYYSNGSWSWRVQCPRCGSVKRQSLNTDGRAQMSCNGVQIGTETEAALDDGDQEWAWSISARLAAVVLDNRDACSPEVIALIDEARALHPAMTPKN